MMLALLALGWMWHSVRSKNGHPISEGRRRRPKGWKNKFNLLPKAQHSYRSLRGGLCRKCVYVPPDFSDAFPGVPGRLHSMMFLTTSFWDTVFLSHRLPERSSRTGGTTTAGMGRKSFWGKLRKAPFIIIANFPAPFIFRSDR